MAAYTRAVGEGDADGEGEGGGTQDEHKAELKTLEPDMQQEVW